MKLYRVRIFVGDTLRKERHCFTPQSAAAFKGYWMNRAWLNGATVTVETADVREDAWTTHSTHASKLVKQIHEATAEELETFRQLVNQLAAEVTYREIDLAVAGAA